MKIDSHQHFWHYHPERHAWIGSEMQKIRRNFLPEDLYPLLEASAIDACIAVQAEESRKDTDFLLELCQAHEWILGVVGWVDLGSEDLDRILEEYSSEKKLLGFREVLQSKDPSYMLRKEFIRGVQKIEEKGYAYDLLIFPMHLEASLALIDQVPHQRFVIDHAAKPPIREGNWKAWKKLLQPIAEREGVYCKLSGLITEANWNSWTVEELQPYLEISLELFGPKRLMFGSDWPVCLVAGDYPEVVGLIKSFTDQLTPMEKESIMGGTAAAFYLF
jgi:L-fuconolactonase